MQREGVHFHPQSILWVEREEAVCIKHCKQNVKIVGVAGIRATNVQFSEGWHKGNNQNCTMVGIRATTCRMVGTRATTCRMVGIRATTCQMVCIWAKACQMVDIGLKAAICQKNNTKEPKIVEETRFQRSVIRIYEDNLNSKKIWVISYRTWPALWPPNKLWPLGETQNI